MFTFLRIALFLFLGALVAAYFNYIHLSADLMSLVKPAILVAIALLVLSLIFGPRRD